MIKNHDGYNIIDEKDYQSNYKKNNWEVAIGINKVDGLVPSKYLIQLTEESISGRKTYAQIEEDLQRYYKEQDLSDISVQNTYECDMYENADIFITCTVPTESYINLSPKKGSLHLNVSLRDYGTSIYDYVKNTIIVDSWENVCRSGTDVEKMHIEKGLKEKNVKTLIDIVVNDCMCNYNKEDVIMINSMGMGSFDIATASYYYKKAMDMNLGKELD